MSKDPILEKYRSEGFGKNAFGWYFNPWIDEYDQEYDPHNDKKYNKNLDTQSTIKDPILEKYRSEGFGQNAFGWYFNPWIDEYDPEYDPHNDKKYHKEMESKVSQPKETEPKASEPKVTQPKAPQTNTTEQKVTDQDKDNVTIKDIQLKDIKITVCPISNSIILEAENQDRKLAPYIIQDLDYSEKFINSEEIKSIIDKVQEKFEYDLYDVDKLDPNILAILNKVGCNNELFEYVASIDRGCEDKTISFKINYDLRDMNNSEMLYNQEKTKISKLAKVANSVGADISKDNIFKRISSKIKSLLSKNTRKKLVENNKSDYAYEKTENAARQKFLKEIEEKLKKEGKVLTTEQEETVRKFFDENYVYRTGKGFVPKVQKEKVVAKKVEPVVEETKPKKTSKLISKAKSIAASIGKSAKNVATEARVIGTRVSGQIRGESTIVTDMKVQNIRNSFVKVQAPVEHNVGSEAPITTKSQKGTVEHIATKKETPKDDLDSIINEVNTFGDDVKPSQSNVDSIIKEVHSWEQGEQRPSDSSFALRARLKEPKDVKELAKEKSNEQEVIIESPDGTRRVGRRLFSRYDESGKEPGE